MARSPTTQHRPQRDTKSSVKENRDLKLENRSLKKQIARLRKQMGRMVDFHMTISEMTDEDEIPTAMVSKPLTSANSCESCGSTNIQSMKIPSGTITVCKACGAKKVSK